MKQQQLDLTHQFQVSRQAGQQAIQYPLQFPDDKFNRPCHFSPCEKYRYTLERVWDFGNPRRVTWIGLNPSTADAEKNDPTVRRCIGFAQDWGFGGMFMANLFAFRSTDPDYMKEIFDPVGKENDDALLWMVERSDLVIACWGNHGTHLGRAKFVRTLPFALPLMALKITKQGQPNHPLYLKKTLKPFPLPSD